MTSTFKDGTSSCAVWSVSSRCPGCVFFVGVSSIIFVLYSNEFFFEAL